MGQSFTCFFLVKYRFSAPGQTCPGGCTKDFGPCRYENRIYRSEISLSGYYDPANWSTPVWVGNGQVGYNVINNARAIRLSNGMIALAIAISPTINRFNCATNFRSYVSFSSDEGLTWDNTQEIETTIGVCRNQTFERGFMEPEIVEITHNGAQKILIVMRTATTSPYYNRIPINNLLGNWELPFLTPFPDATSNPNFPLVASNSPVSIERIPCTGHLLMILNESTNDRDRDKLRTMISTDEGQTWGQLKSLRFATTPLLGHSYASITMYQDEGW